MTPDPDFARMASRRKLLSRHVEVVNDHRRRLLGFGEKRLKRFSWEFLWELLRQQTYPHYWSMPPPWRLRLRRLTGPRVLPDFFIASPIKSGTTDLYTTLLLHPNIMTPLAKEFYPTNLARFRDYYPTVRAIRNHRKRYGVALCPYFVGGLEWVEQLYFLSSIRPQRKLIITLRNPVDRLYSHWKWEVLAAGKHIAGHLAVLQRFDAFVDTALKLFPACLALRTPPPLQQSIYCTWVAQWIEAFGPANVLVLNADDYFSDRDNCLRSIQEFVGIPYVSIPAFSQRINENPLKVPGPDAASRLKLREFYEPYNQKLWEIIGKEFSW
jgi:hypothetical protein